MNKKIKILFLLFAFLFSNLQAFCVTQTLHPNYSYEFLGEDKFEKTNRKVFKFNQKLNKYALRPIHCVWASIMPKYGMDRIQSAYTNIEYPKRLVASLIERDYKTCGKETVRFLTNSTIGLAGMFDPAKSIFNIEPSQKNIGHALAKCKVKQGPYLVVPFMNSATPRTLAGRILETPLDPTIYIGSPLTALVKLGLMVNRTSYTQPLAKMVETNYADPYDIAKKYFGIENYIKTSDLCSCENIKNALKQDFTVNKTDSANVDVALEDFKLDLPSNVDYAVTKTTNGLKTGISSDDLVLDDMIILAPYLLPNVVLHDFRPQNPIVDATRTALFDAEGINKSIWSELSIWNRSFAKKIKSGKIEFVEGKKPYVYRYILNKNENSPLAILYPSIGEGVNSHHNVVFAKLLHDKGFSVVMQGSHFHWEFVNSMDDNFTPGIPENDAKLLQEMGVKILADIKNKTGREFDKKVLIGTSFGAMQTLFVASLEQKEKKIGIDKFISINPPIELCYAIEELDKNNSAWKSYSNEIKDKASFCVAKIIKLLEMKKQKDFNLKQMPFTLQEGQLITAFVLQQKLSDLIYTLENKKHKDSANIYDKILNTSFMGYVESYVLKNNEMTKEELKHQTSLHKISNYLESANNYTVYHTLDDYFVNRAQLAKLRNYSADKLILFDCGSHLGYLYRNEFKYQLYRDLDNFIAQNKKMAD